MISSGIRVYLNYGQPIGSALKLNQNNRLASLDVFRGYAGKYFEKSLLYLDYVWL